MLETIIKKTAKVKRKDVFKSTLTRLTSLAERLCKDLISSRGQYHRERLSKLLEIETQFFDKVRELPNKDFDLQQYWRALDDTLENILEWTDSLQPFSKELTPEAFWRKWTDSFEKIISEIPRSTTLIISEKSLQIKPEDIWQVDLWKRSKKKQLGLIKTSFAIQNTVRKFLRLRQLSPKRFKRQIKLRQFFEYFFELPVAEHLLQKWQVMLQQEALQIKQLHLEANTTIQQLLGLPNIDTEPQKKQIMSDLQQICDRVVNRSAYSAETDIATRDDKFNKIVQLIDSKWQHAGTLVLPNSRYSDSTIQRNRADLNKAFIKSRDKWLDHYSGTQEDWKKDLELSKLQLRIQLICMETLETVGHKISQQILPTLTEPFQVISDSLKRFQEMKIQQGAQLEDEILAENRTVIRSLRREKLPKAMDAVIKAELIKGLNNYISRTKHALESLPEQHCILQHGDLDRLPPRSTLIDVPIKSLFLEEVYPCLSKKHESFMDDVTGDIDKIVRDLTEIDQIIEFNLEAALELLSSEQETSEISDAQTVVIEGLQRAKNRLDDLRAQTSEIARKSKDSLIAITSELRSEIQELADNEKIIELKFRVARAKTREELRGYRRRAVTIFKQVFPSVVAFVTRYYKKARSTYLRFGRVTGLAPVTTDVEARLSEFISRTRAQIAKLPYVYQSLFRIEPLDDERFFEGRSADLDALKTQFDAWQNGQYGVTALVGEKGSGKTTLLNFATQEVYCRLPNVRIELAGLTVSDEANLCKILQEYFDEEFDSLDELESQLYTQDSKKVVIVEDLQNLFLRTVDGFDALSRFLLLVSKTYSKIYWVISCTLYSWRYLDKVLNLSNYFHRVIRLGGLTADDCETIVLKRHRLSGYKLKFEATQQILDSKKYKKLTTDEQKQDYLANFYFEQLNNRAMGNITVTMMFWLSAILKIEEDALYVSLEELETSFLSQLPAEELFTLAALLQHEMLNIEEHAIVFHQDRHQSELLLKRMTNRGLLYEKSNGYFQINFLLYRAVVQTLTIKNIIH